MEVTVNGKKVTLRDRLPAKQSWPLMGALQNMSNGKLEYDDAVMLLKTAIESWEFAGDPTDAASYETLDLFSEMMPLANEVGQGMLAKLSQAKN